MNYVIKILEKNFKLCNSESNKKYEKRLIINLEKNFQNYEIHNINYTLTSLKKKTFLKTKIYRNDNNVWRWRKKRSGKVHSDSI